MSNIAQQIKELTEIVNSTDQEIELLAEVARLRRLKETASSKIVSLQKQCRHEKIAAYQITQNHNLPNVHWSPLICPDCGSQL